MDAKFGSYSIQHQSDFIVCTKCGERGKIVWDDISRVKHEEPELLGIEGPFFERIGRKAPYPIELVCRECGGVAVTVFPSTSLRERGEYN